MYVFRDEGFGAAVSFEVGASGLEFWVSGLSSKP